MKLVPWFDCLTSPNNLILSKNGKKKKKKKRIEEEEEEEEIQSPFSSPTSQTSDIFLTLL